MIGAHYNMDFCANKTLVEVIKESGFGGTYFRDIYSGVNSKWYIQGRLILQIFIVGFGGILDIGQAEDLQMIGT